MKLVPFLAVAALAVSAECLSLFDPSPSLDDFSPELISPDSSEEWAAPMPDSSEEVPDLTPDEDIPSDLVWFRRGSVFRAAAHRMPRVGLRRVIMVSVEPSRDEDQFESDEDVSLPSPPANQRPWSVPRHRWPVTDLSAEEQRPFVFPTVAREHFDWPESAEHESDELSVESEYVKNLGKLVASRLADGRAPRRAPAEWPQEQLKWPREVETPKKPAIMRPVTRVSTPSPFERGLEELKRELKKAEQEQELELDREIDAVEYKYHPNVVQIV